MVRLALHQLRKTRAIPSFRPDWWRTGLWCAQEPEREQERTFGHHNLYRDGVPARSVIISVLEGVEVKDGHSKHEQLVGRWEVPHEAPGHEVFYDVGDDRPNDISGWRSANECTSRDA